MAKPKRIPSVKDPPKIKNTPIHTCPYGVDGLTFGLDYDKYDVCDDCYLSMACHLYKLRTKNPKARVRIKIPEYRRKRRWKYK